MARCWSCPIRPLIPLTRPQSRTLDPAFERQTGRPRSKRVGRAMIRRRKFWERIHRSRMLPRKSGLVSDHHVKPTLPDQAHHHARLAARLPRDASYTQPRPATERALLIRTRTLVWPCGLYACSIYACSTHGGFELQKRGAIKAVALRCFALLSFFGRLPLK